VNSTVGEKRQEKGEGSRRASKGGRVGKGPTSPEINSVQGGIERAGGGTILTTKKGFGGEKFGG